MIIVKSKDGNVHHIDVYTIIDNDGYVEMYVDNVHHKLKTYFRYERTWDDHMGNTPCGYYCNVPLSSGKWGTRERKRVYIHYKGWQ